MKQFVRSLKVFRTTPGRFLSVAVVAAAALTFNPQAQAGSGQGAVVTHINRDSTGWYQAFSPDGQLKLDVGLSGQGDFLRLNPDGTLTWQSVEPKAPITVSVLGDDGWVPLWEGSGSFHITALVVQEDDGSFSTTLEATHLHVQGKLTMIDGSKWSLLVVAAIRDGEFKELKIDLQPR